MPRKGVPGPSEYLERGIVRGTLPCYDSGMALMKQAGLAEFDALTADVCRIRDSREYDLRDPESLLYRIVDAYDDAIEHAYTECEDDTSQEWHSAFYCGLASGVTQAGDTVEWFAARGYTL